MRRAAQCSSDCSVHVWEDEPREGGQDGAPEASIRPCAESGVVQAREAELPYIAHYMAGGEGGGNGSNGGKREGRNEGEGGEKRAIGSSRARKPAAGSCNTSGQECRGN